MTATKFRTQVKMTKKNRLAILQRARDLIADKKYWTHGRLRRKIAGTQQYRYCLLGACEQAVYDLNLAEPNKKAFSEEIAEGGEELGLGYLIGKDISLYAYSQETRRADPWNVNDREGHQGALDLLDGYIGEVKKGRAREATS
jgi:hypothetical protein